MYFHLSMMFHLYLVIFFFINLSSLICQELHNCFYAVHCSFFSIFTHESRFLSYWINSSSHMSKVLFSLFFAVSPCSCLTGSSSLWGLHLESGLLGHPSLYFEARQILLPYPTKPREILGCTLVVTLITKSYTYQPPYLDHQNVFCPLFPPKHCQTCKRGTHYICISWVN